MIPRTTAIGLAAALAAVSLAACGGSSQTKISGSTPSGAYTAYDGGGFSVSVPSGWSKNAASSPADGRRVVIWTSPTRNATVEVDVTTGPAATQALSQLVSQIKEGNGYVASNLKLSSVSAASASVPGAQSAKLVTERGSSSNGPHLAKLLLVKISGGRLITVQAGRYAGNSGFDPTQIVNSFRVSS